MEKNKTRQPQSSALAHLLIELVRWRRILIVNFLIFFTLGLIISLLMPKWYKAETSILPTQIGGDFDIAASLNPFLSSSMSVWGGYTEETLYYISILNSRTVRETAIEKFNLIDLWGCKDIEIALKRLSKQIEVVFIDNENLIKINTWSKSPQLAAELADFLVEELDRINTQFSTHKAMASRIFLTDRVTETTRRLTVAEENLREFQEKEGAYAIDEQTRAMIETAAAIQAQVYQLEVEIEVLESSVKSDHPELVNKKVELRELKNKLKGLQLDMPGESSPNFQIPFNKIPDVGVQYIRLLREVESRQKVLELLLPQLELARIEEVKNTPTVQILDKAVPPLRKAKPKRAYVTLAVAALGTLLTIAYIVLIERWKGLRRSDEETYLMMTGAWNEVKSDLLFWRRTKNK